MSPFETQVCWVLDMLAHRRISPEQAESWLWTLVEMEESHG